MTREEIEQLYVEEPNCFETGREEQWYKVGLKEGLAAADSRPHWIPVEEELPKEGQVVLIHTKGGSVSTACYTDGRFDITELFEAINVTHWMEIQPPRKEE